MGYRLLFWCILVVGHGCNKKDESVAEESLGAVETAGLDQNLVLEATSADGNTSASLFIDSHSFATKADVQFANQDGLGSVLSTTVLQAVAIKVTGDDGDIYPVSNVQNPMMVQFQVSNRTDGFNLGVTEISDYQLPTQSIRHLTSAEIAVTHSQIEKGVDIKFPTAGTDHLYALVVNSAAELTPESETDTSPTLTFTSAAETTSPAPGDLYTVKWTLTDDSSQVFVTLSYGSTAAAACTGTTIVSRLLHRPSYGENGYRWQLPADVGTFYLCASVDDDVNPVVDVVLADPITSVAATAATPTSNQAPTIQLVQPATGSNQVASGGSFTITWTDGDADDDATVALYYKLIGSGPCQGGQLIAEGIKENDTTDSVVWSLAGLAYGSYSICARIDDGTTAKGVWSPGTVVHNEIPAFTFVEPKGTNDYLYAGQGFTLSWTDSDRDSNAQISFYYSTTNSNCTSGTLITTVNENDGNTATWTPASSVASNLYYVCAVIDDSVNTAVTVFSDQVEFYHRCTWLGLTNDWAAASNWSSCSSHAPTQYDQVVIDDTPAIQPVVSTSTTFGTFGSSTSGGGTITINAGVSLTMYSTWLGSDVILKGASNNCSTCKFVLTPGNDIYIGYGATLTLERGITVEARNGAIYVGSSSQAGHFKTNSASSATEAEWPHITTDSADFHGIVVEGSSSANSSIEIDGLRLSKVRASSSAVAIEMVNYYDVPNLTNLKIDFEEGVDGSTYFRLRNCSNINSMDSTWSGLNLVDAAYRYNFRASDSCSSLSLLVLSGSGAGFGESMEDDPDNRLTWFGGGSLTCTWAGGVSSVWEDSGNWSSCSGGVPDANDSVIIATTANDPIVAADTEVYAFANSGSGGGTVTINSGVKLGILAENAFGSNVTLKGASDTCTDCVVSGSYGRDMVVQNSANLTLGKGIKVTGHGGTFKVGNGTTKGTLSTNAGTTTSEWPRLVLSDSGWSGVAVEGAAAQISELDLSGLVVSGVTTSATVINFVDYYQIKTFENLQLDYTGSGAATGDYLNFASCANGTFTDTDWTNIQFIGTLSGSNNIDIAASSCSGVGTISITGSGDSYGLDLDNDPNTVLSWGP